MSDDKLYILTDTYEARWQVRQGSCIGFGRLNCAYRFSYMKESFLIHAAVLPMLPLLEAKARHNRQSFLWQQPGQKAEPKDSGQVIDLGVLDKAEAWKDVIKTPDEMRCLILWAYDQNTGALLRASPFAGRRADLQVAAHFLGADALLFDLGASLVRSNKTSVADGMSRVLRKMDFSQPMHFFLGFLCFIMIPILIMILVCFSLMRVTISSELDNMRLDTVYIATIVLNNSAAKPVPAAKSPLEEPTPDLTMASPVHGIHQPWPAKDLMRRQHFVTIIVDCVYAVMDFVYFVIFPPVWDANKRFEHKEHP